MEIEIKVMWCKGLTAFNFFQKLTVYAAVSLTTHERIQLSQYEKQEQRTPVGKKNQGDLEWNYPMIFNLHKINPNMNDLSLLFRLRSSGQIFGDKTIGEVRVPLKELIQSVAVGSEGVSFVKYEVRNPQGKHNGVLDFSYKLVGNVQIMGYKHHQELAESCCIKTENYMPEDQPCPCHKYTTNFDESFSASNSEIQVGVIQYPKIDLDELSTPLLVYPPPPSSLTSTNGTHYNHSASSQMWSPSPSHYPPPLLQQPYLYPPPTMQPYGDPHWPDYH